MSGLIRHLSILQSHVFLLNSRLGLFTAADLRQRPFSRSYRAILPSSLAMIHSSTLGFSPRLPVSVYGTGFYNLKLSGFSWKSDYLNYPRPRRFKVLSAFSNPHVLLVVWPSSDSPSHQRFAPMQADSVSRKCSCDHAPVVPARIVLPLAAMR